MSHPPLYAVPRRLVNEPIEVAAIKSQLRIDLHDGKFDACFMAQSHRRHTEIRRRLIDIHQALIAGSHAFESHCHGIREELEELIPSRHWTSGSLFWFVGVWVVGLLV